MDADQQLRLDFINATASHINDVNGVLLHFAAALAERGHRHDASKLDEPELSIMAQSLPKMRATTYGSDEYKAELKAIEPALQHHYANNHHHPEHFSRDAPHPLREMTLIDLLEMLADWVAATKRHDGGDIDKSLIHNRERFGIEDPLYRVLENTIRAMKRERPDLFPTTDKEQTHE